MCLVCRHPLRVAIEASLSTGTPLRAVAADYPGLSKSALDRHRKRCAAPPAPASPVATGCNPTLTPIRRRSRPLTDQAERFAIALRMRARGSTNAEIGHALKITPNGVSELIARAQAAELSRVRAETVEDLLIQLRSSRDLRRRELGKVLERATARGDDVLIVSIVRELRHEAKEDREMMRDLGAFDSFKVPTMQEQESRQAQNRDGSLSRAAGKFFDDLERFFAMGVDDPPLPPPSVSLGTG